MRHKTKRAQRAARPQKRELPVPPVSPNRWTFRNILRQPQQVEKAFRSFEIAEDALYDAIMTIDTQWFNDRLAQRRMSQRKLATLMGMDSSAVSLMLRGKRRMSLEEAAQIAVFLNSTTEDVLRAAGVQTHTAQMAPVMGHCTADGSVVLQPEGTHDMVEVPPGVPADTVAIQYRTAGSSLAMFDGWLMLLSEQQIPPERAVDTYALVAVKNSGLVMAHIKRGYKRGAYNILDHGGKMTPNVEIAWASPVLWQKTTA